MLLSNGAVEPDQGQATEMHRYSVAGTGDDRRESAERVHAG